MVIHIQDINGAEVYTTPDHVIGASEAYFL